jgi:dihydrolipoamide dehydrogenase
MTGERFDAIVIGAGPAGEVVASRLGEHGLATALVERELVGGECACWACIPSKTLLRPGEARRDAERSPGTSGAQTRWSDVAEYRDYMIRNLDDENEVDGYEEQGIRVFKGRASLQGPGKVRVGRRTIHGDRLVIATGSEADIPPIEGLAASGFWTNREATTLIRVGRAVGPAHRSRGGRRRDDRARGPQGWCRRANGAPAPARCHRASVDV